MIEFRLLGSVDLNGSEGGTLRSVLAQPKRVALLAYLAVATPNGFHRRDKLLGLFWPEREQERGRGALRKALYFLRQSLGEEVIVSRGDEEIELAEGAVWCDAVAFEEALERNEPDEALDLYRGDLLEGFFLSEVPEFERWLGGERARLRRRAAEAAWALVDETEAAGNGVEAAKWARKAVSLSPNDEAAFRRLLELLDRLGDRTGAIEEYEVFAQRSREEYEAEPSPETQALIAAIREREVAVASSSPERPVAAQAREARAVAPEYVALAPAGEDHPELRPISLPRVLATYAVVSLAVLLAVHIFTIQLGLPDWFFPSALVVLLVCLPIILGTALVQGAAISARRADAEAEGPSAAAKRWLTWRNAVGVTVAAFALLGMAVAGYMAMRGMGIGPWGTLIAKGVLEERDLIVLADFEDRTGDSILALTVTEAMRVMLEQSPVVRVADEDYAGRVLRRMDREPNTPLTYDLAREVAIREGLKAVVAGQVNPAGSGYVVSARLVAAETGETLESFLETAEDPDAIIPAVSRMSMKLRERIGESLRTVRSSPPLSQARTASLEALRLYTEADRAVFRFEFGRANDLSTLALEIDTAFAAAYRLRAAARLNLGIGRAQQIADGTKAYELRHRLPLWERYVIEATHYAWVTGDREKQIAANRELLELRPDDLGALNTLGVLYWMMREYARSEEMLRRLLEVDSLAGTGWYGLSRTLFDHGKFDQAWETTRQWEAKTPENSGIPQIRGNLASAQGDYEAAEVYFRRHRDLEPEKRLRNARFNVRMSRLAGVQGKLAEAERFWRDAMRVYEAIGNITDYLSLAVEIARINVHVRGKPERALAGVEAALERRPLSELEPLDRPYLDIAAVYAEAGRPGRARELVAEYEAEVDPALRHFRNGEYRRQGTLAMIARAEGRPDDAIETTRAIMHRFSPIAWLGNLGRAYELAGQPDSALAVYERYVTTPYLDRLFDDNLWLAFIYERLGDLYEQRGDAAKAILYHGKLVDLWKDADPELQPRVDAARRAIERLSPDR